MIVPLRHELEWYVEQGFGDPLNLEPKWTDPLIINAAITGMVPRKSDTPHVPVTPTEIIDDAARCFQVGASIVHLHARDEDQNPTHATDVYKQIVPVIRAQCPGIVICVTTSGRRVNTLEARSQVLFMKGAAKPDLASLTMGSMNFPQQASVNSPEMITSLAGFMVQQGIIPELEIFEAGMINYARYLARKGVLRPPLCFNLLLGSLGTIPAGIRDLEYLVESLPPGSRWGGAGIGCFQLPVTLSSIAMGGNVRIGLEDNIFYDAARTELATNAQLIERLVNFSNSIGRPVASAAQTRELLGLA